MICGQCGKTIWAAEGKPVICPCQTPKRIAAAELFTELNLRAICDFPDDGESKLIIIRSALQKYAEAVRRVVAEEYYLKGIEDVILYLHRDGMSYEGYACLWDKKNDQWIRDALKPNIDAVNLQRENT